MLKKSRLILLGLLLVGGLMVAGCGAQVENGDIVQVHYTGTLDDGSQFDSSAGREPLEFTVGAGQMIAGFDRAVLGMTIGETKTFTIPAEEAYGPHREELVMEISRDQLPPDQAPEVGQQLTATGSDGSVSIILIIAVTETTVTVDANHALAGKDLTFEIELVAVK